MNKVGVGCSFAYKYSKTGNIEGDFEAQHVA